MSIPRIDLSVWKGNSCRCSMLSTMITDSQSARERSAGKFEGAPSEVVDDNQYSSKSVPLFVTMRIRTSPGRSISWFPTGEISLIQVSSSSTV